MKYKWNIKMGEMSESKTPEHSWDEDRRIQRNKTEIIYKEDNRIIRKLKESEFIKTGEQVISQPSIASSITWLLFVIRYEVTECIH
jgi:hypothetical protein